MTQAKIQLFCRAKNFNTDYYRSKEFFPRNIKERNKALFLFKHHFRLIWMSEDVTFKEDFEELK